MTEYDERFPNCKWAEPTDNAGVVHCRWSGGYPHVGVCAGCHGPDEEERGTSPERASSEQPPRHSKRIERSGGGLCKHANLISYQSGECGCKRQKNRCDKRGIVLGSTDWRRTCRQSGRCDEYKIKERCDD